jgi:hypothetical protein
MDERTSIRVRDPVHRSSAEFASRLPTFSKAYGSQASAEFCSAAIKHVVRQLGLTVTELSAQSSGRYGKESPYFIPVSFPYRLKQGITPRICQIVALSQITCYRFSDWMRICGFDPRLVLDLQLQLDNERTTIINPGILNGTRAASTAPSNRVAKLYPRYLFAKIGTRDAVVYPRLVPGTIVRADRAYGLQFCGNESIENRIWLVEHAGGVTCCHIKWIDDKHLVLLPNLPPLTAWPLQLWREVQILGLVDLEWRPGLFTPFRPMSSRTPPDSLPCAGWSDTSPPSLSRLLRLSRARAGLTLRGAHEMTTRIAQLLGRREYTIALGLLSDYEAMNRVPRHVAKIISLCVIYGIDLFQFLEAAGVYVDDCGKTSLTLDQAMDLSTGNGEFASRTTETLSSVA